MICRDEMGSTANKSNSGQRNLALIGGEMAKRMAEFDWASTSLQSYDQWPQSLKTIVSILLGSLQPMVLLWGFPDLVFIYNDAYIPILGPKHPFAIGKRLTEVWGEVWDALSPLVEKVQNSQSFYLNNLQFFITRNVPSEETYFSFSYSPIYNDNNQVAGIYCPLIEITSKVLQERRLKTFSELSHNSLQQRTINSAFISSIDILSQNRCDIPFALLYSLNKDTAILQNSYGFNDADFPQINPAIIHLNDNNTIWPIDKVRDMKASLIVSLKDVGNLPLGMNNQPLSSALIQPITIGGFSDILAVLILGVSPCQNLDGDYKNFFSLIAEQVRSSISKAKAIEDKQQRIKKMTELDHSKNHFLTNVSHDFRTPLSLILSPLESLINSEEPLKPHHRNLIETAHRNSHQILELANSLMHFSTVETKRMEATYEQIDLPLLTSELASVFRSTIENANLKFIVNTPPFTGVNLPYVDRDIWEKIVFNLLSNAIKFTSEGTIEVSLKEKDNFAVLKISDTGRGISELELPQLFERFRKVDGSKGRAGMGLSLVEELVNIQGGNISVKSVLGKGTTFKVSIPLGCHHLSKEQLGVQKNDNRDGNVQSSLIESHLASDQSSINQCNNNNNNNNNSNNNNDNKMRHKADDFSIFKARILITDESVDMRNYLKGLLEKEQFCDQIIIAEDGEETFEKAIKYLPDLILCDTVLPKLGGIDLIQLLRSDARTELIPIILISARGGEEAKIRGLRAGADDYLMKPFSSKELVTRVKSHLTISRIRKTAFEREKDLLLIAKNAKNDMNLILNNFKDGFMVLNRNYEMTYLNPAVVNFSDKCKDELLGKSFFEVHPDTINTPLGNYMRIAMEKKESVFQEYFYPPHNRWYENRISPHYDGICLFSSDITSRKKLEVEKQQAIELARKRQQQRIKEANEYQQKQSKFIDTLCHELRNPLNGIYGGLSIIESDFKVLGEQINKLTPENCPVLMEDIFNTIRKLEDTISAVDQCARQQKIIIDDVLDLSKLDNNKVELNPVPFSPYEVIQTMKSTFNSQLIQKNLKFITTINTKKHIKADPLRLKHIITNLLSNAIKFTPNEGTIELKATLEQQNSKHFLHISIADTGVGLEPEEITRLFDRFEQANRRTKAEYGGSGLGLTICKILVEAMGGCIRVTSERGKGSNFYFYIECEDLSPEELNQYLEQLEIDNKAKNKPEKISKALSDVRVLVVEDNTVNQKIIGRFLDMKGCKYVLANNGREAVDLFSKHKFDLIFMDVEMPVLNGIQASEIIRGMEQEKGIQNPIPIIGMSGNFSDKQIQIAKNAGMNDYLTKPYTKDQLSCIIDHFISK